MRAQRGGLKKRCVHEHLTQNHFIMVLLEILQ